jgi:hypothetical protein
MIDGKIMFVVRIIINNYRGYWDLNNTGGGVYLNH